MIRSFSSTFYYSLLWMIFLPSTLFSQKQSPNVLLIYTDDHRYSGVHALAQQAVQTPNLDALAADGIVFENTYLMGSFSGATCIPSRAMLMTGRNLFDLNRQGHLIPREHTTMGEAFQKAGYQTQIVGKWHQDNASLSRSFEGGATIMGRGVYLVDHFRMPLWDWDEEGQFPKDQAYLLQYNEDGTLSRRQLTKADQRGPIGTASNGPHTSEIFAAEASKFIEKYDAESPFFLYLAFHAPHDPRQAPERFKALYPPSKMELPPSYLPQHPFDNGHMVLRDEELVPWPRTPEIARKELADYYAIITHLDAQIGKVIQSLKASGQYENTLIVFAGDSGLAVGNHGLLGKQNIYDEDGVHVPFVLSGGVIEQKGVSVKGFSYIHDIFPTVCEWVGVPAPSSVRGQSLVPLIKGEESGSRSFTYHAYRHHQRAYRKGNLKLIEYVRADDFNKRKGAFVAGSRVTQLFDVESDPWETTDLSFQPAYQDRLAQLRQEMRQVANQLGDSKDNTGEKFDFWDFYQ
ncbi:MAG: sulfatase-like hydrolase/transferase [Saprospiraceae bacterium]|nr:sulfatase-like hydrolase/transferase [Saprospiraceae bacterium]